MNLEIVARVCLAAMVVACSSSLLAETIVFGPKTYTVSNGEPQTFREDLPSGVESDCPGRPSFMLVVRNGGEEGGKLVRSAKITIDGTTVIRESDFLAGRTLLEVPVRVVAASTMSIQLKGGPPGSRISLLIRRTTDELLLPEASYTVAKQQISFTGAFSVSDLQGRYVAVIGTENGTVTGFLNVNGVTIVGPSELSTSSGLIRHPVVLQAENTFRLDLSGKPGASVTLAFARAWDESECGPRVRITAPAENGLVDTARIAVFGTLIAPRGTGVAVNGAVAQVDFSHSGSETDPFQWFAEVGAEPGTLILEAVAVDPEGSEARERRGVVFAPSPDNVPLDANHHAGIVPETVAFHLPLRSTAGAESFELDLDGDGVFERTFAEVPDVINFTYRAAGVFHPRVRCTKPDGRVLSASTSIVVQSLEVMDQFFQAAWQEFSDALNDGDVPAAVAMLSPEQRPKYGAALNAIRPDLASYTASVVRFAPVSIHENSAHYLLVRLRDGQRYGYHVYFVRGNDGVWRLDQF